MFIESHKMALLSFKTDIDLYMIDGVVADDKGAEFFKVVVTIKLN